ncbi:MAG: site-specific integrase [Actinomycetota bacterium]|nr:site-specific integrase [Actinomycetota bacterium]
MARRKQPPKDLTGIRRRGGTFQVRVSAGLDPVTGRQLMLSGSANTEDAAILIRDRLRQQVRDNTAARTNVTLGYLLDEWLSGHQVEETTRASYRLLIDGFIRPALGDTPLAQLCRQGPRPFERLYAELRICRRRCHGRAFVEHRTPRSHDCDQRCAAHVCKPLTVSSIRQCHAVLSGALSAAKRWGWITVNPLEAAQRPRTPAPQPDPPSAEEAAKIANAAWTQDPDWGTFVWLTFITGARRGELVALAWEHVDLVSGLLTIRRSLVRRNGKTILKDTKTHQMRVIKLDQDTIGILREHKARAEQRCAELSTTLNDDAFVFSYAPDHRRHCDPDAITHRYAKMTADLGIDTHLHALRHYSATELLAGGVDLRTVAGRLGHAGGGATTLKVYAAWLAGADTKAADLIASRLPRPPQVHIERS